jgi:uncharacterized protein YceK
MKRLLISIAILTVLTGCDKLQQFTGSGPKQSLICDAYISKHTNSTCVKTEMNVSVIMDGKKLFVDGTEPCFWDF